MIWLFVGSFINKLKTCNCANCSILNFLWYGDYLYVMEIMSLKFDFEIPWRLSSNITQTKVLHFQSNIKRPVCRSCFLRSRDIFFNNNYGSPISTTESEFRKVAPVMKGHECGLEGGGWYKIWHFSARDFFSYFCYRTPIQIINNGIFSNAP